MSSQVSRLEDGQTFLYIISHSTGRLFTVETCLNAWIAHVGQQQAMESVQDLKTPSFILHCKTSLKKCQGILCAQQLISLVEHQPNRDLNLWWQRDLHHFLS